MYRNLASGNKEKLREYVTDALYMVVHKETNTQKRILIIHNLEIQHKPTIVEKDPSYFQNQQ
jgi:hypothetical protein